MLETDGLAKNFRWRMLGTVLAVTFALGYLSHLKGVFESRMLLSLEVDSAAGLFEGMKVTYKGFELGRLAQLELGTQGEVRGILQIRTQHAAFFTQGAVLKLSKEKIVTSELVLVRNEAEDAPMASMSSIKVLREDVTADVAKRLDPLLSKLHQLLTQMADPEHGVQAGLNQSRKVMAQTAQTLEDTSHAMRQLSDDHNGLPAVLGQTRDTMAQLEKSLLQTQTTLGSADRLIQHVDDTVNEVKSAPLYKWLVPKNSAPASKP